MMRRIYQLTEQDRKKAAQKEAMRQTDLAHIEAHKDDKIYWKNRRTTYGLAKRDASKLALAGDVEFHEGRGQGLMDQLAKLPYTDERRSPAYNAGYYEGYDASLNAMREYIAANPNFAFTQSAAITRN